jgi:hypothetical protein
MGKDILHPVVGQKSGKRLDLSFIPKESFVFPIPLEPLIIPEPAMLEPDSVGTQVMSPILKGLARGPKQIRQAHHTEDGDQQKKRAPRTFLLSQTFHCSLGLTGAADQRPPPRRVFSPKRPANAHTPPPCAQFVHRGFNWFRLVEVFKRHPYWT